jgi:hypothetical protein
MSFCSELCIRLRPPPPPVGPKPAFLTSGAAGLAPDAVSVLLGQESATESIPQVTPTTKGDDRLQQSPIAYAWYEAPGSNVPRIQVYVRPTGEDSRMFKFETSTGESMSGTELEVAEKYLTFHMRLKDKPISTHDNPQRDRWSELQSAAE